MTRRLTSDLKNYIIVRARNELFMNNKITLFLRSLLAIGLVTTIFLSSTVLAANHKISSFSLPDRAKKVADNLYFLGKAKDKDGREVEGYAIIHQKKDSPAKPSSPARTKGLKCYGFLAVGAKWKGVEPWVVNPSNSRGLRDNFVFENLTLDIVKWEAAADGSENNGVSVDILGDGEKTNNILAADTISPDNKNEIYFADVEDDQSIAVTVVWGIFGGPPQGRELVEWDQVYDEVDYDWSSYGEVGKMDFENIATHELGHSFGLDDLYDGGCSEETMFGYAANGEIKKRDLSTGDITGISSLYK